MSGDGGRGFDTKEGRDDHVVDAFEEDAADESVTSDSDASEGSGGPVEFNAESTAVEVRKDARGLNEKRDV